MSGALPAARPCDAPARRPCTPRGTRKLVRLVRTAALDATALAGHARARRRLLPGHVADPAAISLQAACFTRPSTGVARYVAALARHLPAVLPERPIVLRGAAGTDLRGALHVAREVSAPAVALHHVTWQDFAGHHNWPLGWAPRSVLTVHDLINLVHADYHPAWERWWYGRTLMAACRAADRVLVPSRATAEALSRLLGREVPGLRVVPHGVEPTFGADVPASGDGARLAGLGLPDDLLLCVSTLYAHKGLETLLDAYASLRERRAAARLTTPALVIVGEPLWEPTVRALHARLAEPALAGQVHLAGYVGEADLVSLYRRARALVFPSTLEGFGLPVLEAMALGTPVVSSDAASLPEVAGDAALLARAGDAGALAAAIEQLLASASLARALAERGRERARRLTWRACASATAAVYGELLDERHEEVA